MSPRLPAPDLHAKHSPIIDRRQSNGKLEQGRSVFDNGNDLDFDQKAWIG
jgi:hypothetical protein